MESLDPDLSHYQSLITEYGLDEFPEFQDIEALQQKVFKSFGHVKHKIK